MKGTMSHANQLSLFATDADAIFSISAYDDPHKSYGEELLKDSLPLIDTLLKLLIVTAE